MELADFSRAEFTASYGISKQLPASSRPEIVFAGRSNVGKSSLINKLCNRKKLAKVSGTPGKTATINFYSVGNCFFVDLPGYGYAKTSNVERRRWDDLINGYFQQERNIALLLQLLDCRHEPSKNDVEMLEYLKYYNLKFIAVLTKYDKLKSSERNAKLDYFKEYLKDYPCSAVLSTSAEKSLGIIELQKMLLEVVAEEKDSGI